MNPYTSNWQSHFELLARSRLPSNSLYHTGHAVIYNHGILLFCGMVHTILSTPRSLHEDICRQQLMLERRR